MSRAAWSDRNTVAAACDPLDRAARAPGGPRDQRMFDADEEVLGAEAAADIRCHEAHILRFEAERSRHGGAVDVDVPG